MKDGMTAFLEDFALYSNTGAIVVILSCLASMAFYIYKISGELGAARMGPVNQHTPAQIMGNVNNPFVVNISNPSKASCKDGITVQIMSQVPCIVLPLWGVNIAKIYNVIHSPWQEFREGFVDGLLHPLLEGHVLHTQTPIIIQNSASSSDVVLQTPHEVDLGTAPRDKYPLVVLLLNKQVFSNTSSRQSELRDVVAMIALIHVRDEVCTGQSQLIAQFVRMQNSKIVHNLQQLYVPGDTTSSSPQAIPPDDVCVVCQVSVVTHVCLPCRHACVCQDCFKRLTKCPMCRAGITTYFALNNQQEEESVEEEDSN